MNRDSMSIEYAAQLNIAKQFIEQKDDFLVVSHIQPDGDAASSTLVTGWMLQQLGKKFVMINEGELPSKFNYLWGFDLVTDFSEQGLERKFQNIISVDCADFSRIGKVSTLFEETICLLNIDHHPTNDFFGSHQLIKSDAAATVEILYDLAEELQMQHDLEFGECIYTGLLTDTGGFRYSSTSPKVMQIAADLLQLGVRGPWLAEQLLEIMTLSQIHLLQKALPTLSFAHEKKLAWLSLRAEDILEANAASDDLDGLVNYPRNVEGVEVGILFKQKDAHTVKVSLRSAGKVDVAQIAKSFGGGGHVRAAGCTLYGELNEIVEQMVKEVGQAL